VRGTRAGRKPQPRSNGAAHESERGSIRWLLSPAWHPARDLNTGEPSIPVAYTAWVAEQGTEFCFSPPWTPTPLTDPTLLTGPERAGRSKFHRACSRSCTGNEEVRRHGRSRPRGHGSDRGLLQPCPRHCTSWRRGFCLRADSRSHPSHAASANRR